MLEAIRAWLKPALDGAAMRTIHVVARVHPVAEGWELELSIASPGGTGEQTLIAQQCRTLADVVALNAALATNPTTMIGAFHPADGASNGHWLFGLRAAGGAALGPLPGPVTPIGAVFLSVGTPHARVELGTSYFATREVRYASPHEIGATLDLLAVMLRACAVPAAGVVQFPLCAGLDLGDLRGVGFGGSENETADWLWLGLEMGPSVSVPIARRLYASLEADAGLSVTRPRYSVRNLGVLYDVGPASARAWAGLEYRFP